MIIKQFYKNFRASYTFALKDMTHWFHIFFGPSVTGGIRTLDISFLSQMFYHCATAPG
jgi:hypothetical protein